ncbi:MAG: hypothetical protein JWM53_3618, partial [bacterium]|nr:hypothetical protein [bacterium]
MKPPGDGKWRELANERRRAFAAACRARLAADPRVQAMKQALKDRAKQQRNAMAAERKERRNERAVEERARSESMGSAPIRSEPIL